LAKEGVLDLSSWQAEQDEFAALAGEWAFYWETLLSPADIAASSMTPTYVDLPDDWSDHAVPQAPLPPSGFATYQLELRGLNPEQTYGLFIDGPNTAYRLWVDGREIAHAGQVGTSMATMLPLKLPQTAAFRPQDDTTQITVQISNFHHRNAGMRHPILLHTQTAVQTRHLSLWVIDVLLFGIFAIFSLYHLGLYYFRPQEKSPLFFALLTTIAAVRILVSNQNILLALWPEFGWVLSLRIGYLTFFWGMPFYLSFLKSLYPRDIPIWIVRGISLFAGLFSLFAVFESPLALSYRLAAFQWIFLLAGLYLLWVIGRLLYLKREGASLIALASATLLFTSVIDILSNREIFNITEIFPFGVIIFIFIQAILIAWRFSEAFVLVETTQEELRQSEEKYRTIFEESRDVIFLLGDGAQILDVSPSAEVVFGYSRSELRQMRMHDFVVEQVSELFAQALRAEDDIRDLELEFRRQDGRIFPGVVTAGWRYNDKGEIMGMQGHLRDISHLKIQEELARDKEIAEAANQAKSAFLANMSHELRTPLTAILGYAEMLQEDAIDAGDTQQEADLSRIHEAGTHLLALINNILDLSKVEAGKMKLHLTTFDVSHLTLEMAVYAAPLLQANGNRLVRKTAVNMGDMTADETKVKQILLNLLSNAAKFTSDGVVTLGVNRQQVDGREEISFTVNDTGIGMTPAQLDKLFVPFEQADEKIAAEYGGTGLGMALTRRLCQLMGGSIMATSEKGVGSTFVVKLPAQVSDDQQGQNRVVR
jgi:PAS domain S-box-containing protein